MSDKHSNDRRLAVESASGQSNLNLQWGCFTADVLAELGVETVVVSPGSRSAPLALGFHAQPSMRVEVILDERAAAFHALGLAKGTQRAVVMICTSGSAAAHYYPALIEAHYSELPLLVLSADRPPELRQCFSGQTIDQNGLYAGYMRWQTEIALPQRTRSSFAYLRQTLRHAFEQATGMYRGPVHLNFPFSDPLHPEVLPESVLPLQECLQLLADLPQPVRLEATMGATQAKQLWAQWKTAEKGLIVVGPSQPNDPDSFAMAVTELALHLGWPVLCDGLTPLRTRCAKLEADPRGVLSIHYDCLLRDPTLAARLRPDQVISIGPLPVSKALRAWLDACDSKTWVMGASEHNLDGLHRKAAHVRCRPECLVSNIVDDKTDGEHGEPWRQQWRQLEDAARHKIQISFERCSELLEPMVVRDLAHAAIDGSDVFVANSMPVRDLECFWPTSSSAVKIHCNRGANGIDGNLATGLGIANHRRHVYIVIGDLAFAHDLAVLFNHPRPAAGATIVVVNNGGGGIFRYLPVAGYDSQAFNELFFTPHQLDFEQVAKAARIEWVRAESREHYRALIAAADTRMRLIEVCVDSAASMSFRNQTNAL